MPGPGRTGPRALSSELPPRWARRPCACDRRCRWTWPAIRAGGGARCDQRDRPGRGGVGPERPVDPYPVPDHRRWDAPAVPLAGGGAAVRRLRDHTRDDAQADPARPVAVPGPQALGSAAARRLPRPLGAGADPDPVDHPEQPAELRRALRASTGQGILVSGDAGFVDFAPPRGEYYPALLDALLPLHVVQVAHHAGNNAHFYRALLAAGYADQEAESLLLVSHATRDRFRPSDGVRHLPGAGPRGPGWASRILFTSKPSAAKVRNYPRGDPPRRRRSAPGRRRPDRLRRRPLDGPAARDQGVRLTAAARSAICGARRP